MKKIYCFMGKQGKEFEKLVSEYDADNMINLYDGIIQNTQGEVTCYINEISQICAMEDGELWFVTDVKALYHLITRIYPQYFEKMILLDENTGADDEVGFDVYEHLDFELSMQTDGTIRYLLNRICELRFEEKNESYISFSIDLYDDIEKKDNAKWWDHIILVLLEIEGLSDKETWNYYSFLLSILMQTNPSVERTNLFLENVLDSDNCTKDNAYFIWNQFKGFSLFNQVIKDSKSAALLDTIYQKSYNAYLSESKEMLEQMPYESRNHNLVVVFTIQLLEGNHAPTKTTLERVKTLCQLGKEVLLVNTAEQYLIQGYFPCYNPSAGTVVEEYNQISTIGFGDFKVSFMQMPNVLPLMERLKVLVQLIQKAKPEYILSIGTGSMLADLCGHMVPCASMALAFSTLPHTMNKMKILGRNQKENEKERTDDADIIESRFTFELKPQKIKLTRKKLGLPENRFLLVVIGIRLDSEVGEAFLDMLDQACSQGCFVAFAGKMSRYHQMMERHIAVKDNSAFIGYQDDILALMEIADLYVNPERLGGGFSVIEAFHKGKPGVYLRTGDVYVAGGETFAVSDFDEMLEEIVKYKNDKGYYDSRAKEAVGRAALMTDSVTALKELDAAICQRVKEKYW